MARSARAVPQAQHAESGADRPAVRSDALGPQRGDGARPGAGAAPYRDAAPRVSQGAPARGGAVPPLRSRAAPDRGGGGDHLLQDLSAALLSGPSVGDDQYLSDVDDVGVGQPVR